MVSVHNHGKLPLAYIFGVVLSGSFWDYELTHNRNMY